MPFIEIMNRILCEYGLWLKETSEPEPCRGVLLANEGEVTAYISALHAFRRGKVPVIKG